MTNSDDKKMLSEEAAATPVVRLLELGAHFALAERAAKIGYWRHQIGEREAVWSPGFCTILELPPDVRPSTSLVMSKIHPDDRAMVATAVGAALVTGKPFYYRSRSWDLTQGPSERFFDTHGDVERGPGGEIIAVLGVVREVTAEVVAERRLKESEATYRFMTDEATDIITRYGPEGMPVFVSPAVTRILGYDTAESLRMSPFEIFHPDDAATVKAAVEGATRNGSSTTYTHRARRKDGEYVWLESRLRFVTDPSTGKTGGAISVTRDITVRKQFEDELQAARTRAEAASATKSRFLANMSHELRTPLNAIIGFSDILKREMFGPLSERYAEYAQLINNSGAMLLELINDLLDMSKIEAGKFELFHEDFAVGELIADSLQLLTPRAKQGGIVISVEATPHDVRLNADKRATRQILLNLVSNAIKFTKPGGSIFIDVREAGNKLRLSVRDTGVGIAKDVLPRLAQPFEQASNDATRTQGGTGLGLALVKSLTQLHGGEFKIESEEGQGTTVTVDLPISRAASSGARQAS
jgi:PAS domain S-box-containing protein